MNNVRVEEDFSQENGWLDRLVLNIHARQVRTQQAVTYTEGSWRKLCHDVWVTRCTVRRYDRNHTSYYCTVWQTKKAFIYFLIDTNNLKNILLPCRSPSLVSRCIEFGQDYRQNCDVGEIKFLNWTLRGFFWIFM